jgi:hypothetical protein
MKLLRIVPLCLLIALGHAFADDGGKKAKNAKRSVPAKPAKAEGQQSFVPGGVASSFVIPKNTCESGTSIQKLLTDKPPSDKPDQTK